MQKDHIIGLKIAYYRKLNGLTQEKLAERIGVSSQAISKWEQQISCPDIMLLPELARIFGITIDELFGNKSDKVIIYSLIGNVPWNDDGKLRIAVYHGRKLMAQSQYICTEGNNSIDFRFDGEPYRINGECRVNCVRDDEE